GTSAARAISPTRPRSPIARHPTAELAPLGHALRQSGVRDAVRDRRRARPAPGGSRTLRRRHVRCWSTYSGDRYSSGARGAPTPSGVVVGRRVLTPLAWGLTIGLGGA